MKKWLIIISLLILLLTGGFFVITKLVTPKAVKMFVPVKWQNIPLGQARPVVHEYLGEPNEVSDATDTWLYRINAAKSYSLTIFYGVDSLSRTYKLTYEADIFGYKQVTPVSADSIP